MSFVLARCFLIKTEALVCATRLCYHIEALGRVEWVRLVIAFPYVPVSLVFICWHRSSLQWLVSFPRRPICWLQRARSTSLLVAEGFSLSPCVISAAEGYSVLLSLSSLAGLPRLGVLSGWIHRCHGWLISQVFTLCHGDHCRSSQHPLGWEDVDQRRVRWSLAILLRVNPGFGCLFSHLGYRSTSGSVVFGGVLCRVNSGFGGLFLYFPIRIITLLHSLFEHSYTLNRLQLLPPTRLR